MKKQVLSALFISALAVLSSSAFAQTAAVPYNSTTGLVTASGYTQVADLIQNMGGVSISNASHAMSTAPTGAPAGWANNWDTTKVYSSAIATQSLTQDGLSKVADGAPATVTGTGVKPNAVMANNTVTGASFGMSSQDSGGVNRTGGANLFSQVSNTTQASQVQDKNADGSPKFDGSGNPVMIDGTSVSAYAGQIGPDNTGTAAWFGANQKLTQNSAVGAVGNNTGTGTLNISGTQAGSGNQSVAGALSAPAAGVPSASMSATMNVGHTTGLNVATAVASGSGASIAQYSSFNQSKGDQTYLIGAKLINPACTVNCKP